MKSILLTGFLVWRLSSATMVSASMADSTSTGMAMPDSALIPANSTGEIDFAVDAAGFKGASGETYVELYLLLRPSQFVLEERKDKKYQATFSIDVAVKNDKGDVVKTASEQRLFETDQPVLINRRGEERVMMDQIGMAVPPGSYHAAVKVTDINGKREGTATKAFVADAYHDSQLTLSDLQFSGQIKPDETSPRFGKNGLLVMPNPMRIFEKWVEVPGADTFKPRTMYVYFEMYNLTPPSAEQPATYNVNYHLTSRSSGNRTPLPSQKNLPVTGKDGLKVFAVDFMTFPPDVYNLEVTLRDNASGVEVTRQSVFEVVQPPPPPPPVTVLTKQQADRGYKMLKFFAPPRDLALYQKLDLEGKTEFLVNFWRERDPTPDTPENEVMILFNERFSFAEYQLGGADGDRGKIFMKYGEPEEIERFESSMGIKPYQIWYYVSGVDGDPAKREGGNRDFFVFGDRLNVGRYELLHCTAKNETYNPDWRKVLDLATPQTQFTPTELKPGESGNP